MGRQSDPLDGTGGGVMKVAVVTGGSRGIGRACAEALAAGGWRVAIGYRTSDADAKETLAAIEQIGATGRIVKLDALDESSVAEGFKSVSEELGLSPAS